MTDNKRRKFLKVGVGLAVALILVVITASLALRSNAVMSKVLPPLQSHLKSEFNIDSKIEALTIDLLGRVSLKRFSAQWADAALGEASLSVDQLTLRFSLLALLSRRLQVASIELSKPRISVNLGIPQSQSDDKPPMNPLSLIRGLVESPPVALQIEKLEINGAEFDIRLAAGKNEIKARINDVDFRSSLVSERKILRTTFSFAINPTTGAQSTATNLSFVIKALSGQLRSLDLQSRFGLQADGAIALNFVQSATPQLIIEALTVKSQVNSMSVQAQLAQGGRVSVGAAELGALFAIPETTPVSLAKIFELEQASGPEFSQRVVESAFQSLASLKLSTQQSLSWKELGVDARLPRLRAALNLQTSARVAADLKLSEKGIEVLSSAEPLNFKVSKIQLNAPALEAQTQNLQLGKISHLEVSTPFVLRLSKPSFVELSTPMQGLRIAHLELSPKVLLNTPDSPFISARVAAEQSPEGLITLATESTVTLSDALLDVVPVVETLFSETGLLRLKHALNLNLKSQWTDLQQMIAGEAQGESHLGFDFRVGIEQMRPPKEGGRVGLTLADGLQVTGRGEVHQPLAFSSARLSAKVALGETQLTELAVNAKNIKRNFLASGTVVASAPLSLRKISPLLDELSKLGGITARAQWDLKLPHTRASVLHLDFSRPELLRPNLKLKSQIEFNEKPTAPLFDKQFLTAKGPVDLSLDATLTSGAMQLKVLYAVPQVGTTALASVRDIQGQAGLQASLPFDNKVKLNVNTSVRELSADPSLGLPQEIQPYLKDIKARLAGIVDLGGAAEIELADVTTGGGLMALNARGGSDLNFSNSRFSGALDLQLPATYRYGIRAEDQLKFAGRVRADWQATQKELKNLRLRGTVNLDDLSVEHTLARISKMRGSVPFEQMLQTPDLKSLRWSYLINDNPFKRVDSSKFTPLTVEDSLLTIERMSVLERELGPLRARVSLKQNILNVDKLDADLFEGVLAGQAYVDIQPAKLTAGLQGRVTKLNTSLLSRPRKERAAAPLSARLSLKVDLSRSLIEGRADVTEIGKNQLLALIDVLDPAGSDALLNKARLGLGVGYPRYVGLLMSNGFLDMNVALGGVLEQSIEINNLPLSPIVNAKTQDIVKVMREVPIQ